MKYLLFLLLLISGGVYSQTTQYMRVDTLVIEQTSRSATLFLKNATRNKTGAYLRNYSGGRTDFGYAMDSASLSGSNLTLWRGAGTQNIVLALPGGGGAAVAVQPGILKGVLDSLKPEIRYFSSKYSGLYQQGEETPYVNSYSAKVLNAGLWISDRDGPSLINVDNVSVMHIGGWGPFTSTDSVFVSTDGGATFTFLWLAPWGGDHSVPTFKADDDYWYHVGGDYQSSTTSKLSVWRSRTPLVLGSWVRVTSTAAVSSRILHDAIGFNNALYWYGGQYTTNWSEGATDTVWRSDDGGFNWVYHATAPDGVFDKNINKTSVIRGNRVFFVAGGRYDDGTPGNRTFDRTVYSTADFITFRTENSIPSAGVQYPAVFLNNGMVGYFGGLNSSLVNTNNIGLMDRDGQWHVGANYDSTRTAMPITHAVGVTNFKDHILFIGGNAFNRSYSYARSRFIKNDSVIHFAPHRINDRLTISESPVSLVAMFGNNLIFDAVNDSMYRYNNLNNGANVQVDGVNNEIRFAIGIGPDPYVRVGIKTGTLWRMNGSGEFIGSTNPAFDAGDYKIQTEGNVYLGNTVALPGYNTVAYKRVGFLDNTNGLLDFTVGAPSTNDVLTYNGTNIVWAAPGGGGLTGFTTFGSTPNANGGSVSGANIILQPADGSNPGGVSTGAQTFAGDKTFSGKIDVNALWVDGSVVVNTSGLDLDMQSGGFTGFNTPGFIRFGGVTGAPGLKRVNSTDLQLMDANGTDMTSRLGIGIAPTARLHLLDGTTVPGTAPLKFTSGTNLTAAEAGAMEWNGTNLFITQTTGPTRKTLAYTTDIVAFVGASTYTPTLTNTANLDASTAHVFQYSFVTDPTTLVTVVTVSGYVEVDPTTTLVDTQLTISVPLTVSFTNVQECGGTGNSTTIAAQGAGIRAVASSGNVMMQWKTVDTTNQPMYLTFTYKINAP